MPHKQNVFDSAYHKFDPTGTNLAQTKVQDALVEHDGLATRHILHKIDATADPTTGDDSGDGYAVGSIWVNTTSDDVFICQDATLTAAVWERRAKDTYVRLNAQALAEFPAGLSVALWGESSPGFVTTPAASDSNVWSPTGVVVGPVTLGAFTDVITEGFVENIDTSAYSVLTPLYWSHSSGVLTSTKPTEDRVWRIGFVLVSHATTGVLYVRPELEVDREEIRDTMGAFETYNGFQDQDNVTLSYTQGTRTPSISPVSGNYTFWSDGVQYERGGDFLSFPDLDGLHFIYYDENGVDQSTQTFSDDLIDRYCLIAMVYWNVAAQEAAIFGGELHGMFMDPSVHTYLHNTKGAAYASGFALGNFVTDDTGDVDSHAQLSVADGVFFDEDIKHSITDGSPQDISPIAKLPLLYKDGASGLWRRTTATNFPVTTTGTGRAAWNENNGGVWSLTEADNNDFVFTHIIATNDINEPIMGIIGQGEYNTLSAARDGAEVEALQLATSGLEALMPEFVFLGTVIFQTSDGYANTVQSRIRTTNEGDDYIDWREVTLAGGGGTGEVHDTPVDGATLIPISSNWAFDFDASTTAALATKIGASGVTFENLDANGDVGTGAAQVAAGDHNHTGVYEPVDATILRQADVDDTPVDGVTTAPVSSNWAFDITNGNLAFVALEAKYAVFTTEYDNGNQSTAATINLTNGQHQKVTLTGNAALTLSAPAGKTAHMQLAVIQDATGSRTPSIVNAYKKIKDSSLSWSTAANAIDLLNIYWNGTTFYIQQSQWEDA